MSTAWLCAVCLMATPADGKVTEASQAARTEEASQPAAQSAPEAKDLPEAVYDAIRRFRRSSVREREKLVPELVTLYQQVPGDAGLAPKQQGRLLRVLERRLRQAERTLHRRVSREARTAKADTSTKPSKSPAAVKSPRPGVLVQQIGAQGQAGGGGGLGGAQGGQTAADAQQLIDLIRATICPDAWAVNGGNGRIFYYSPVQALVVTH